MLVVWLHCTTLLPLSLQASPKYSCYRRLLVISVIITDTAVMVVCSCVQFNYLKARLLIMHGCQFRLPGRWWEGEISNGNCSSSGPIIIVILIMSKLNDNPERGPLIWLSISETAVVCLPVLWMFSMLLGLLFHCIFIECSSHVFF